MKYQHKREPLTTEELGKLYEVTEDFKDKLILYTLLDTGLRVSEFCGLTKNNILWQRDAIRVTNGKGDKKRTVPMTPRVKALLSTQFAMSNIMPFKELMVQLRVKRLAEKAGITKKVTPHVLRHTFAVRALRKGVDIRALQKVLGHDSLETTAIYLNYDDETTMKSFKDAGWL